MVVLEKDVTFKFVSLLVRFVLNVYLLSYLSAHDLKIPMAQPEVIGIGSWDP